MAEQSELQSEDPIELQEIGSNSRSSRGREDSDSFALRQAGKTPVLRVSPGLSITLSVLSDGNPAAEFQPPFYVRLQLFGPWHMAGSSHVSWIKPSLFQYLPC